MNKEPKLVDIENVFQPAREINEAGRFAGRRQELTDAYSALISIGTNIAIVGNRGIGKTSLARQIDSIASGDHDLLDRFRTPYDRKLDYLTFYFACGNTINNIPELLKRLLTSKQVLYDWIYDIPAAKEVLEGYSPELSVGFAGIGASVGTTKSTQTRSTSALPEHPIDAIFTNVCHAIVEEDIAKDGLLFVLDEFDQIGDPSGMAGLLKSLATNVPKVKFCIVGVGEDIRKLMKEHKSADRLFAGSIIKLPPMSDDELKEIIRIAEQSIGSYITFDESATDKLVRLAQGHPYMVHLVGKYALKSAFRNKKTIISADDVDTALVSIAERGADPVLEGRYTKAVGSSRQREIVLKALAQVRNEDGESWTTDAYKLALDEGVENASHYVGQLVTEEYGSELERVRERYYRFKDSLFAAYVLARPKLIQ